MTHRVNILKPPNDKQGTGRVSADDASWARAAVLDEVTRRGAPCTSAYIPAPRAIPSYTTMPSLSLHFFLLCTTFSQ